MEGWRFMVLIRGRLEQSAPNGLVNGSGKSHLAKYNGLCLTSLFLVNKFPAGPISNQVNAGI